ncbi:MAG: hypothetical protein GY850_45480, partial [bacterium]|nr:hypothetical protein [bacterium]
MELHTIIIAAGALLAAVVAVAAKALTTELMKDAYKRFKDFWHRKFGKKPQLINGMKSNALGPEEHEKDGDPAGKSDPSALRVSYLNKLFEDTAHLSLTGVDPKAASESEARLNLGAVYTALLTHASEAHEKFERQGIVDRDVKRLSALDQLNSHQRLVLLGDPGSGKS